MAQEDTTKTGEDLAKQALAQSAPVATNDEPESTDEELAASDKLADTLTSLQHLIERHANEVEDLKKKLREKSSSLRDVFDNDPGYAEAQAEIETHSAKVKEHKARLQSTPQITSLKVQIAELREQKKELEETLSNHLVNYHSLTHSNSFDTSDGDQWEFSINAKIKPRKVRNDDV